MLWGKSYQGVAVPEDGCICLRNGQCRTDTGPSDQRVEEDQLWVSSGLFLLLRWCQLCGQPSWASTCQLLSVSGRVSDLGRAWAVSLHLGRLQHRPAAALPVRSRDPSLEVSWLAVPKPRPPLSRSGACCFPQRTAEIVSVTGCHVSHVPPGLFFPFVLGLMLRFHTSKQLKEGLPEARAAPTFSVSPLTPAGQIPKSLVSVSSETHLSVTAPACTLTLCNDFTVISPFH